MDLVKYVIFTGINLLVITIVCIGMKTQYFLKVIMLCAFYL